MKNVILTSISRGTPKTRIVMELDVDGVHERCTFRQVPGETGLGFDETFSRIFAPTQFARPLGSIAHAFTKGRTPQLPLKIKPVALPRPIAHK